MQLEFSQQIFEKYSNIEFNKICPVVAELFHTGDGRTHNKRDMTKLIVAYRSFSNETQNLDFYYS
jgi:hypothetical protein